MTMGAYATASAADERQAILASAYLASVRGLLAGVEEAREQGWAMQPEPVGVQDVVADVVERLRTLTAASGLRIVRDAAAARDVVCCADPAWLRKAIAHLLLRSLALEDAPPYVQLKIVRRPGEVHLRVLSSVPDAHRDAKGDLRAIQRLMAAMGAEVVIEPLRAGCYPVCLVLTSLSAAPALSEAA